MKLSNSLRDADFSETQATVLAAALSEQASDSLATKADLLHVEMTLGERITELRAEMIAEFAKVRTEMAQMRNEMSKMRGETIKWIVAATAFNIAANAGLFKLFAR